MIGEDRWLLPEGIEELLPPAAWRLERLRRRLLDLYSRWGYELVIPAADRVSRIPADRRRLDRDTIQRAPTHVERISEA